MSDEKRFQQLDLYIEELEDRIRKLESIVMRLLPEDINIPASLIPEEIEYDLYSSDYEAFLSEYYE